MSFLFGSCRAATTILWGIALLSACDPPPVPFVVAATPNRPIDTPNDSIVSLKQELFSIVGELPGDTLTGSFVDVRDVAIDAHGSTYVLDGRLNTVHVYDSIGRESASFARAGGGPGEFAVPRSIQVDTRGRVTVFDQAAYRFTRFRQIDHGWHVDTTFAVSVSGTAMCAMGDRYYLLAWYKDHLIHEFDLEGRHLKSFGGGYGPTNPLIKVTLADGILRCSPDENRLIVASTGLPEVRAYDASDGTLAWSSDVTWFQSMAYRELENGAVAFVWPETGTRDFMLSVTLLSDSALAVQVGRVSSDWQKTHDLEGIVSYRLALADGRVLGSSTSLPWLREAAKDRMIVYADAEYPILTVHRYATH